LKGDYINFSINSSIFVGISLKIAHFFNSVKTVKTIKFGVNKGFEYIVYMQS